MLLSFAMARDAYIWIRDGEKQKPRRRGVHGLGSAVPMPDLAFSRA
jgi:hypothetical protein